jgi:PAS domain S-box-containing protein
MLGCMLDISDLKLARRNIAEREARLRSVLEAAAEAIITTDAGKRILSLNPAAEDMFHYAAADVLGMPVTALFTEEPPLETLARLSPRQPRTLEARPRQGELFPLELSARHVPDYDLWVLVGRDVSEQRRLERDVIDLSTSQQETLGRELHDGLGQELTALVMLAHGLRKQVESNDGRVNVDGFARLEEYLARAQDTCRGFARGLSAEVWAPGLENSLGELANSMEQASGIQCRFSHTGPEADLAPQQSAHLYRIAQEAVNNAVRHGEPTTIDIGLEVDDTEVILRVQDNGRGIPPNVKHGLGLRLMAYRAGMIGGTCELSRPADGGTLVECRIPRAG